MNHPSAPADLDRLLRVAKNQRGIMLCILGQIAVAAVGGFLSLPPLANSLLSLLVGLASLVFLVALARNVYSTVGVVVCVVFLLIPFVGVFVMPSAGATLTILSLLTLLVVNQRATKELRAAGFKVGLLGGSPAEVESRMQSRAI